MTPKFLRLSTPKKSPLIDAKEKKNNKVYDQNKRRRIIVPGWKVEFEWLMSDKTHGKLYCKQCRGLIGCTPLLIFTIYSFHLLYTFLLYGHISPTLGPEPLTQSTLISQFW